MTDIHFSCPHCGGSLVVDDEGAGWEVDCPACSEPIVIPLTSEGGRHGEEAAEPEAALVAEKAGGPQEDGEGAGFAEEATLEPAMVAAETGERDAFRESGDREIKPEPRTPAPSREPVPAARARTLGQTRTVRGLRSRWLLFRCAGEGCDTVLKLRLEHDGATIACPECGARMLTAAAPDDDGGGSARTAAAAVARGGAATGEEEKSPQRPSRRWGSRGEAHRVALDFPTFDEKASGLQSGDGREAIASQEAVWVRRQTLPWDSEQLLEAPAAESAPVPPERENRLLVALAIGGIVILVGGLLTVLLITSNRNSEAGAPPSPGESPEAAAHAGATASADRLRTGAEDGAIDFSTHFALRTRGQAKEVLTRFLEAGTLEERLRCVLHPERVREIVERRQDLDLSGPIAYRKINESRIQAYESEDMVVIPVEFDEFTVRDIALGYGPEGYKVDWEWFAEYGELSWDALFETRPVDPVMFRVVATPDNYFNYDFDDDTRYDCYRLHSSSKAYQVYGYVAKDSPAAAALREAFNPPSAADGRVNRPGEVECVLRIRYPRPDSIPKMVEITDYVQTTWAAL